MPLPYNKKLIPTAKKLRRNITLQEKELWYNFLSFYPVRCQRQKIIGRFIVDFYCAKAMLAIEVDGSQHYTEHGIAYDEERSQFLSCKMVEVLRFKNEDIEYRFREVCLIIDNRIISKLLELSQRRVEAEYRSQTSLIEGGVTEGDGRSISCSLSAPRTKRQDTTPKP